MVVVVVVGTIQWAAVHNRTLGGSTGAPAAAVHVLLRQADGAQAQCSVDKADRVRGCTLCHQAHHVWDAMCSGVRWCARF